MNGGQASLHYYLPPAVRMELVVVEVNDASEDLLLTMYGCGWPLLENKPTHLM